MRATPRRLAAQRKAAAPKSLEIRKILIVGYAFDAPEGAVMLHGDGLPMRPVECPIRMRIAFWVPQPEPFQRREVGTFQDYLKHVVRERNAAAGVFVDLDSEQPSTASEYAKRHHLDEHLLTTTDHLHAFTFVASPTPYELQALRDGVIVEQIQDCTFARQPSVPELRKLLMPHWEQRVVASLGYLPNRAPEDHAPKPTIIYESI